MMKKVITCLLVIVSTASLRAQQGNYFLSHHAPSDEHFDHVCFDMAQDQRGIMYFAMKTGILEYDGRSWELIPGAGAVYTLDRNSAGEIFWTGAKGFGKIGLDPHGFKQMQLLSDSSVSDVFQTLAVDDEVFFLTDNRIFHYRRGQAKSRLIISGKTQSVFTGIFELFGVVYVQTEGNTIFRLEQDKLVYVNLNLAGNVTFSSRIDNTYVLGTTDNRVYTCYEDLVMRPIALQDQPYADANVVVTGAWVNRQLLALGTLKGGVMLVNPATGQRDQIIDYSTGLPDNEVFALLSDAHQNIWVAHEYGFTQISPSMPFRSFNHYEGIEGNMLCAYSHQNSVYVGTSLGLFKLSRDVVYDEVVTFVDVEIPQQRTKAATKKQQDAAPAIQEEAASRKKGFFDFLRRNRKKEKAGGGGDEQEPVAKPSAPEPAAGPRFRKEKRVDRVLRSTSYVYKRVAGIEAKITHLAGIDGKLIAAGLGGVYEIRDLEAEPIMNKPARYMYASPKKHTVIVSTYHDEVWSLHAQSGWQQLNLINSLGDQIGFIFEGARNEWWLCGLDRIYQLQLEGQEIVRLQTIELTNPNFEKTVGIHYQEEILLVNGDGFYRFDRDGSKLARIDSLPRPFQYFAFDGNVLYRDAHRWHMVGLGTGPDNLELLNLFQNLRFIATDQDPQNLWLIDGDNDLFKFYGEKIQTIETQFPLFLKSIQNQADKIADFSDITINQRNSAVTFEVAQPDFTNPRSIEFRYMLEGMGQGWSEWSSANNKINFPYLPPGKYELQVQARNIFGKITSLSPVHFEVIPPYWKQSWFYALEFMILASLVILSFRLSTRYRIISRLLSLITIILLIEFIQTVIGSSIISDDSPVLEFIIQVIVALLILPVEGFLRKWFFRSLDASRKQSGVGTVAGATQGNKLPDTKMKQTL